MVPHREHTAQVCVLQITRQVSHAARVHVHTASDKRTRTACPLVSKFASISHFHQFGFIRLHVWCADTCTLQFQVFSLARQSFRTDAGVFCNQHMGGHTHFCYSWLTQGDIGLCRTLEVRGPHTVPSTPLHHLVCISNSDWSSLHPLFWGTQASLMCFEVWCVQVISKPFNRG